MSDTPQPEDDQLIAAKILVELLQNNLNTLGNSLAVAQGRIAVLEKEKADRNTAVVPRDVKLPSAKVNN